MVTRETFGQRFRWQVSLTLLIMACVIGYLAHMRGVFDTRLVLNLQVESASGLSEGMKVTYKGFELGRLTTLTLSPQGRVQAAIEVRSQHAPLFTQGSVLRVSKEKIVTSELVLVRDETVQTPLSQKASIAVVKEDVAADITKRLDPLLQRLQELLTQMADPANGIQASLSQSQKVMVQTVKTLEHTSHAMTQLSDEQTGLPPVLVQTRESMVQLNKTLAQTQTTLGSANQLIQNVDRTVDDVKSAPVYQWLVPKKPQPVATKP